MVYIKTGQKIISTFLAVILLVGICGFYLLEKENDSHHALLKQEEIIRISESLGMNNLKLFSFSQMYLIHGEHLHVLNRVNKEFLESFEEIQNKTELLEKEGVDSYSLSVILDYSKKEKSLFDEIVKIHNAKIASNDSETIALLESQLISKIASIEDADTKMSGAISMIIEDESKHKERIVRESESTSRLYIVLFVSALIISFSVSSFISQKISRNLSELNKGTLRITEGNLNIRLKSKSEDELGDLAESFNKMTRKLKASRSELKKTNQDLEKKVNARTHELQEKLDEIERFNNLSVGRELRMIELKKKISELEEKLAKKKRGK